MKLEQGKQQLSEVNDITICVYAADVDADLGVKNKHQKLG